MKDLLSSSSTTITTRSSTTEGAKPGWKRASFLSDGLGGEGEGGGERLEGRVIRIVWERSRLEGKVLRGIW